MAVAHRPFDISPNTSEALNCHSARLHIPVHISVCRARTHATDSSRITVGNAIARARKTLNVRIVCFVYWLNEIEAKKHRVFPT